jgi:hypothetical protein
MRFLIKINRDTNGAELRLKFSLPENALSTHLENRKRGKF